MALITRMIMMFIVTKVMITKNNNNYNNNNNNHLKLTGIDVSIIYSLSIQNSKNSSIQNTRNDNGYIYPTKKYLK